jgi:uncharacterized protein YcfJ
MNHPMTTHCLAGALGVALACAVAASQAQPVGVPVVAPASTPASAPPSPKAQLAADTRAAQQRYDADKKLCNDEATAEARLQCRRDAKGAFDKAVADAKARARSVPVAAKPVAACPECGSVESVKVEERKGKAGAGGMILGGVGGAILGHQVGGGTGKDIATVAGAVGGAYAGKKIEEKMKAHKVWVVNVVQADGTRRAYEFDKDPGFKAGERVRPTGDTLTRH